ncbi:MAG TPA: hypothetical protein VGL59_04855 [Polyangia bacterium]
MGRLDALFLGLCLGFANRLGFLSGRDGGAAAGRRRDDAFGKARWLLGNIGAFEQRSMSSGLG